MTNLSDRQLGAELRRHRINGVVQSQALASIVKDLLGAEQGLMAPLLHLVQRPGFLAIDPVSTSAALRMLGRDSLLRDAEETYHPRVLARLRVVLDGYLDLWDVPPQEGADLEPTELAEPGPLGATDPEAVSVPSDNTWARVSPSPGSATAPPAAGTPAPEVQVSGLPPHRRTWSPFAIAAVGLALALVAGAALRIPALCRPLGWCDSRTSGNSRESSPSEQALRTGEAALKAMRSAQDLTGYERGLGDLNTQLLRLSGDPLNGEQLGRRDRLQAASQEGQSRTKQERSQARTVSEATGRIDGLPSLTAGQAEVSRAEIRSSLNTIPASSFSHGEARKQLQRLNSAASVPPSPPHQEPAAAPTVPAPEPPPAPAPAPRSQGGGWKDGGGGGGSRSAPEPAPAAPSQNAPQNAPQNDGGSNAPYRDEPLF